MKELSLLLLESRMQESLKEERQCQMHSFTVSLCLPHREIVTLTLPSKNKLKIKLQTLVLKWQNKI